MSDKYCLVGKVERFGIEPDGHSSRFSTVLGECYHYAKLRIRELERQVEKLTVERDTFSGTACANGQLDGGGRCGICVRCKANENAALRDVLRELPAWEIMRNRRRLRDHIAADCRERGVKLEGEK